MTNLTESSVFESGIYQIETDDPVLGGTPLITAGTPVTGHSNAQAQQLANRTKWLNDNKVGLSDLSDSTDPLKGSSLVGYKGRSLRSRLSDQIFVDDYSGSDLAKIQAAIDDAPVGSEVVFGNKEYDVGEADLTVTKERVTLNLRRATLTVRRIFLNGAGCGIVGDRARIFGILKIGKLSGDVAANSDTWNLEPGHEIVVGQYITSSYFPNGDKGAAGTLLDERLTVTSVVGNTITTAASVTGITPSGAYIGNFSFGDTVRMSGAGCFIKGVDFRRCTGYAFQAAGKGCVVEDVTIDEGGCDLATTASAGSVICKNVQFLKMYDAAKQAMAVTGAGQVFLKDCKIATGSNDAGIYIFGATTSGCKVTLEGTVVDGRNDPARLPAPYNGNMLFGVHLGMSSGAVVDSISIRQDCEFYGMRQGVVCRSAGDTTAFTINQIEICDSKIALSPIGDIRYVTSAMPAKISDCQIWQTPSPNYVQSILTSETMQTEFIRNKWLDITATILLRHCKIENCKFVNCTDVQIDQTAFGSDNWFEQSRVRGYPYFESGFPTRLIRSKVKHSLLTTASDLISSGVFSVDFNASIDFDLAGGTLSGVLYSDAGVGRYYLYLRALNSGSNLRGLYGDDWNIPLRSVIELMNNTTSQKWHYVNKSNRTTLAAAAPATSTSITVTNATGFAVGDRINILQDSGFVHSTTITSVSGTTIGLTNAVPTGASINNNVCAFLAAAPVS